MTTHDGFDRTVTDWLVDQAGHGMPDYIDEILNRTTRTRQRPAWSSLERWLPVQTTMRFSSTPRVAWLVAVLALAVALVGVALVIGSRQPRLPAPFGLAADGEIAYWVNGDIVVSAPDGSNEHPIIVGPTEDYAPLYSRDGTRLAFWRAETEHTALLMIAGSDGSAIRSVLPTPLTDADWFEWSPDSMSLAVVHSVGGKRVLSIVETGSGTIRPLDTGELVVDNSVYWRPGATDELIYTARSESGQDTTTGIFSIHSDGTGLTTIAPIVMGQAEYLDIDLAPDGRSLTYWRWQEGIGSRIHRLDLATGRDRDVKLDPSATGETGLRASPDGSLVVFQREGSRAQLMVAPADASGPGRLVGPTFGMDAEAGYGFAPDGASVFLAFPGEEPHFYDVATGAELAGPSTPSDCCAWQRLAP